MAGPTGEDSHDLNGTTPRSRMEKYGSFAGEGKWHGENLATGGDDLVTDPASRVLDFVVDDGMAPDDKAHRWNIFATEYKIMGAAVGYHKTYGKMVVEDFASGFSSSGDTKTNTPSKQSASAPKKNAAAKKNGCNGTVEVVDKPRAVITWCKHPNGKWTKKVARKQQEQQILLVLL